MDAEIDAGAYATDYGIVLTSDNVTTFKTYHKSLDVRLTDNNGVALIGENVSITVNGTTYLREVTPKGYASLAITFQPGEYDAIISYDGNFGRNQTNSRIIVKKTLFSDNLNVFYGEVSEYNVSCLDEYGDALTNYEVDFCVDGKLYDRYVNDEGICSYNISALKPGNHSVISYNLNTNEFVKNFIFIKSISAPDTFEVSKGNTEYSATFVDENGTPLADTDVLFRLNGKDYTRTSDENGTARLSITLEKGTYALTVTNPATGEVQTSEIIVSESLNLSDSNQSESDSARDVPATSGVSYGNGTANIIMNASVNSTGNVSTSSVSKAIKKDNNAIWILLAILAAAIIISFVIKRRKSE